MCSPLALPQEHSSGIPPAEIEESTLNVSTAMVFPAIASVFLLLLYFLLQAGITSIILIAVNLVCAR